MLNICLDAHRALARQVANAFEDFELPGRFCKRVRRVTRFQFKEVLYFLAKGLAGLTEEHVALLCDVFDDGFGLIRYREFVKAVDLVLEKPGAAGIVHFHCEPYKTRNHAHPNSPEHAISMIACFVGFA
jgi:hypothetical protein